MKNPTDSAEALSPGLAETLRDNPEFADLAAALAAAPDEPAAAAAPPLAPRVLAAIAAGERRRRARLRLALLSGAAAAAAAIVAAFPSGAPEAGGGAPGPEAVSPVAALVAAQRPDGSWGGPRGGEALAPAATGLAVLKLAASGAPEAAPAIARAAAWLRAAQNADGSFGRASTPGLDAPNLALPAAALLRLYGSGDWPELFTPADAAVAAVRGRLAAGIAAPPREGDVWLAAALSIADGLDWPDSGDLRRSLRRFAAARDLSGFRGLSLPESRTALARALDTALL